MTDHPPSPDAASAAIPSVPHTGRRFWTVHPANPTLLLSLSVLADSTLCISAYHCPAPHAQPARARLPPVEVASRLRLQHAFLFHFSAETATFHHQQSSSSPPASPGSDPSDEATEIALLDARQVQDAAFATGTRLALCVLISRVGKRRPQPAPPAVSLWIGFLDWDRGPSLARSLHWTNQPLSSPPHQETLFASLRTLAAALAGPPSEIAPTDHCPHLILLGHASPLAPSAGVQILSGTSLCWMAGNGLHLVSVAPSDTSDTETVLLEAPPVASSLHAWSTTATPAHPVEAVRLLWMGDASLPHNHHAAFRADGFAGGEIPLYACLPVALLAVASSATVGHSTAVSIRNWRVQCVALQAANNDSLFTTTRSVIPLNVPPTQTTLHAAIPLAISPELLRGTLQTIGRCFPEQYASIATHCGFEFHHAVTRVSVVCCVGTALRQILVVVDGALLHCINTSGIPTQITPISLLDLLVAPPGGFHSDCPSNVLLAFVPLQESGASINLIVVPESVDGTDTSDDLFQELQFSNFSPQPAALFVLDAVAGESYHRLVAGIAGAAHDSRQRVQAALSAPSSSSMPEVSLAADGGIYLLNNGTFGQEMLGPNGTLLEAAGRPARRDSRPSPTAAVLAPGSQSNGESGRVSAALGSIAESLQSRIDAGKAHIRTLDTVAELKMARLQRALVDLQNLAVAQQYSHWRLASPESDLASGPAAAAIGGAFDDGLVAVHGLSLSDPPLDAAVRLAPTLKDVSYCVLGNGRYVALRGVVSSGADRSLYNVSLQVDTGLPTVSGHSSAVPMLEPDTECVVMCFSRLPRPAAFAPGRPAWSASVCVAWSYLPLSLAATIESSANAISTLQLSQPLLLAVSDAALRANQGSSSELASIAPWRDWSLICTCHTLLEVRLGNAHMGVSLATLLKRILVSSLGLFELPTWAATSVSPTAFSTLLALAGDDGKERARQERGTLHFTTLQSPWSDAEQFAFATLTPLPDAVSLLVAAYPDTGYLASLVEQLRECLPGECQLTAPPSKATVEVPSRSCALLCGALQSEMSGGSSSTGIQASVGVTGSSTSLAERLFQQYVTDTQLAGALLDSQRE